MNPAAPTPTPAPHDLRSRVFPPLPLPSGPPRARPARVCIASFDFVGPVKNGGVGTAFTSLGEALAAAGHEVTLLYLPGKWCENRTLDYWIEYYAKKHIRFVPMPDSGLPIETTWHTAKAYEAYLWLQQHPFDVIHFSEWKGPGYFCLRAKHQDLAFANTLLCVHTHGPTLWHKLSNAEYVTHPADLEADYLERRSARLADVLVSPSQYLLRWMLQQEWQLPEQCFVQPYARPATARQPLPDADRVHRIKEFVFFGRLEVRKGLVLFCDALDQLKNDPALKSAAITFLGKVDKIGEVNSAKYVAARAKAWPWKWQIIGDRDQAGAMDYLQGKGRLAVLPSLVDNLPNTVLECLGAKVPFIASDAGGIPEMIAPADLKPVCFPLRARALAEKLQRVVRDGMRPATPAVDSQANDRAWVQWHDCQLAQLLARPVTLPPGLSLPPRVSVCMSHWNRPHYLKQALASIEALDYPNFEVVLVDDGSTQPEALQYVEELAPRFASRGWQLLRNPENRYPGAARNRAAQAARGEFIMFMDDDNCAKPHELSTFVKVALHTGADIVTCALDTFSGKDAPHDGLQPKTRWLFLGDDVASGALRNCFGDTNSLIRREVFLQVGGFHEDWGVGHEDWEFFAKAVLQGYRLECIPEPLAWYRLNDAEPTVNRKTPLHANHMANIRPYVAAVPPQLRHLVLLAQGQLINSVCASRAEADKAYTEATVLWRSKFEAGRILAGMQQTKAATRLMLDAVQAVTATKVPGAILDALLEIGPELYPLSEVHARQAVQLAGQLAKKLGRAAEQERASQALAVLSETNRFSQGAPSAPPAERAPAATTATKSGSADSPALKTAKPALASIVLLARNQLPHTRACLESIAAHTPEPHEVIVVDNGSTDDTPKFLKRWQAAQANRTVIRNETNLGFAAGNNQGLAVARGAFVVLLNNDTVVTPGWLTGMVDVLQRHPHTGVVGPMSNRVSGPQLVEKVGYSKLSELPAYATRFAAEHRGESVPETRVVGFCLLARREVISAIGGLDEQFGSGNFEDDDWCIRAQLAGFGIRIAQGVFVHHTGGQTFQGERIDYRAAMLRNWELFKRKWQIPAGQPLEAGYPTPERAPDGISLKIPLPAVTGTAQSRRDGAPSPAAQPGERATGHTAPVEPPGAVPASRSRLDEANALFERGQALEALQRLHEAISKDAQDAAAWRLGGRIALSQPEFLEFACDWTGEAVRHLPHDEALLAQRAEVLLLSQQCRQARPLWDRIHRAQGSPESLAALLFCDLAERTPRDLPRLADQASALVSRAFVEWYRRCAAFGAGDTVASINARLPELRQVLPEAAAILEAVVAEVATAETAASSV